MKIHLTCLLCFLVQFSFSQSFTITTDINNGWQITREPQPMNSYLPSPLPTWITDLNPALPGSDWFEDVKIALLAGSQITMPSLVGAQPIWITYDNCFYTDNLLRSYCYYFRRPFYIDSCKQISNAKLRFTADNSSRVFINGKQVIPMNGPFTRNAFLIDCTLLCEEAIFEVSSSDAIYDLSSDSWSTSYEVDVTDFLQNGDNLIAIEGINFAGCGLNFAWILANLEYQLEGPVYKLNKLEVEPENCFHKGSISLDYVNTDGNDSITYSLNDGPFQDSGYFNNLNAGNYAVKIHSSKGCDSVINVIVIDSLNKINLTIDQIDTVIGCSDTISFIELKYFSDLSDIDYYFDGQNMGSQNRYEPLDPGDHTVYVKDKSGCVSDTIKFGVNFTSFAMQYYMDITPESCLGKGSIEIIPNGSIKLQYSIDGGPIQSNGLFNDLDAGYYIIQVSDSSGCYEMDTLLVPDSINVINLDINDIDSLLSCTDSVSFIDINYQSDYPVSVFLDNQNMGMDNTFMFQESGTHQLWIADNNGCSSDTISFNINTLNMNKFDSSSYFICIGDTLNILNNRYSQAGHYTDSLVLSRGCKVYYDIQIDVSHPSIDTSLQLYFCKGDSIAWNGNYYWNETEISEKLTGQNGCDSLNRNIKINYLPSLECRSNCAIYIPNVFSPNHDGSNDEFEPQVFNATITEMYIFDRWGEELFHQISNNPKWDGYFKGQLMDPGVFVYIVKGNCFNDDKLIKTGSVTLIR